MPPRLKQLKVSNYRCLADVTLELGGINVFFGPNGSGKSALLDALWFVHDCRARGVDFASAVRGHGFGLRWQAAEEGEPITFAVGTDEVEYELRLGLSSGRIEPWAGETLVDRRAGRRLIERSTGTNRVTFFHASNQSPIEGEMPEPEQLNLLFYLGVNPEDRASAALDHLVRSVRLYHCRSFDLGHTKAFGSETSAEVRLDPEGTKLWSVLRNLQDRRATDARFATILGYLKKCFPILEGVRFEQTGPQTVYAYFQEQHRRAELPASSVSDGYLQQVLLLTVLFGTPRDQPAVLMFDEPELSLHPWPLTVFAEAVKEAANDWNKQVLLATHSPVLLSQFDVADILATEVVDGRTQLQRMSEKDDLKDLLDQYALGSLYMAEMVGGQGRPLQEATGG